MKTRYLTIGLLTLSALALGCGATPESDPVGSAAQALVWNLDASALTPIPPGGIPATRLQAAAFAEANTRANLLNSTETFQLTDQLGTNTLRQSPTWGFETDFPKGKLIAFAQGPSGPPAAQNEAALQADSLARMAAWGLPGAELQGVSQKRLMAQTDSPQGAPSAPVVMAYKTFLYRGVLGVRVAGHRAVVTHDRAGQFRKALVHWPAYAPSGHLLHTPLTIAQIQQRASDALNALGKTQGQAKLRWTYVPSTDQNGQVQLTLKVAAMLPAIEQGEAVEEPEVELVDVSAVP